MRLPVECFAKLHHLPHPMPGNDDHYKAFSDMLGKDMAENHRPSFKKKPGGTKRNALPYFMPVCNMQKMPN